MFVVIAWFIFFGGSTNDDNTNKEVLNKLSLAKAKFGYYLNKTFSKKLLSIYYIDHANIQEVISILPLLKEPYSLSISHANLNQSDMIALSQNSHMQVLDMVDCTYSPDGSILKNLSANKNLIELGFCCRNTDMQLPIEFIDTIPQISSLRIIASNISEKNFKCIKDLHLINLDLTASSIPDECMSIIAGCNSIKSLSLRKCKFYDHNSIRMISKMERITTLDLSECNISKKILDSFINHPTLKEVIITDSRLCEDDINLIKDKRSGLPQIIGNAVCACSQDLK